MAIDLVDEATEIQTLNLLLNSPDLSNHEIFSIDLFTGKRQEIARAVVALHLKGNPVNPNSIGQYLKDEATANLCWKYMARGGDQSSWNFLCGNLLDRKLRRRLDEVTRQYHTLAHEHDGPVQEVIPQFEADALTLQGKKSSSIVPGGNVDDLQKELIWRNEHPGEVRGIRFGMRKSEQLTDGLLPGHLVTIAARPSAGKTALLSSMLWHQLRYGIAIPAVFSLEMRGMRIQQRLLASESGVSMTVTRDRAYTSSEIEALHQGTERMKQWNWFYNETPRITIMQMVSDIRRLSRNEGVNIVYVDYLQLIRNPELELDERLRISSCTENLKLIAEECGLPVVVAAQLRRQEGVFERKSGKTVTKKPRLEDLKGSGSIEEDSDVVGLLDRDQVSNDDYACIDWAKNRDGEVGTIDLAFSKETTTFREDDVT